MRKVDVAAGIGWIGESFRVLRAYPLEFASMGLIFTVIPLIPLLWPLGMFVMLLLGPALLAGMIYAAREASRGNKPQIGHLFRAFREHGRVGSLIALSLPVISALLLIAFITMPIFEAIRQSGAIDPQKADDVKAVQEALRPIVEAMAGRIVLTFFADIAIMFVAGMLTFFAAACILFGGRTAFAAMRMSFTACIRNFGAYLVTVLLLGFGLVVVRVVLSQILPVLFVIVLGNMVLSAIIGPLTYAAYRSIFEDAEGSPPDDESGDQPPSPPPHTIEA